MATPAGRPFFWTATAVEKCDLPMSHKIRTFAP